MSSYSDLATQIINKKGEGGRFSGLNQFLDVKQAYADAQRKFQMDQQLAKQQGLNQGYASIINSANVNGTEAGPALTQFKQAVDNNGVISPSQGAGSIASGSVPVSTNTLSPVSSTPTTDISSSDRNEAALANLTPQRQALIKNLADYKGDPSILAKGNAGRALLGQVAQYDPNFDASQYSNRKTFIQGNWNKGPLFQGRQAVENMVQHADLLQKNFDKMDNGKLLIANAAGNTAKTQLGQAQVNNAMIVARALGTETAKTLRGGGVIALQDEQDIQKQLQGASSPDQMKGAIQQMIHLATPRINSALEDYKGVMGKYPKDAYSPEAIAAIKKLSPDDYNNLAPKLGVQGFVDAGNQVSVQGSGLGGQTTGGIAEGTTATNPQTGHTLTYRGGKWQ